MKQLLTTIRRDGEKPAFKYNPAKPALLDVNDIRKLLPHRYPFLMVDKVFHLDEVSIGHALICDALYLGLEETIKRYLDCLK